jgi:rhodanese-related sulfurtransferase
MKRWLPFLALGLSVLVVACGEAVAPPTASGGIPTPAPASAAAATPAALVGTPVRTDHGLYTDISTAQFAAMMEHKDFFLVDVHVPHEGRLPNLDARIPYDQIAQHLDQLPADKSAKIVLTCYSDSMSNIASRTLADLGYTNIYNLVGGFTAWRAAGHPLLPEEPGTPTP